MSRRALGAVRKRRSRGRLTWTIRYSHLGVRYEEGTASGDERAARALLAERRAEIAAGTWTPPSERASAAEQLEAAHAKLAELGPGPAPSVTVAAYLDERTERRRAAGVRSVGNEAQWFKDLVIPQIGAMPLGSVQRTHVRDLMRHVATAPSKHTGEVYSPRSVLHVYRALSTAFADAVLDGLLAATPCTLRTRKGELPRLRDASPTWRAEAVYTREELGVLLGDERIPEDRRVFYALLGVGGLRASEACGRRWSHYDASTLPLGRLTVATQADGNDGERPTKTGDTRTVPVHPVLAEMLGAWKATGWPMLFGRRPEPTDPIVPSRSDMSGRSFRLRETAFNRLVEDLERVGLRRVPSPQHSLRATFLSLLEVDGANMAIARRATHAAPSDVVGGYIRTTWADLCREVAKLRIERGQGAAVVSLAERRAERLANEGRVEVGARVGARASEAPRTPQNPAQNDGPTWGRSDPRRANAAQSGEPSAQTPAEAPPDSREIREGAHGRLQSGGGPPLPRAIATLRDAVRVLRAMGEEKRAQSIAVVVARLEARHPHAVRSRPAETSRPSRAR